MCDYFKEQISNIQKMFFLAKIDLIKVYRGATLGWFWAIFKPIFTIFVYYITFTIGLRTSKTIFGFPYFLWLISGIIPWFFIKDCLYYGCECIRKYDYLVTKVKFPVSIIPTFCTISKLIVHFIMLLIMIIIFLLSTPGITIYALQLPIYMILMLIYFNFLSLIIASLSAVSKDFLNLTKTSLFAIFWLSGVIWDIANIDIPWLKYLLYFNPVTFIVNGYRNCFIKHVWFWEDPISFISFIILTIITIILSIYIYNRLKKDIPDLL